MVKKLWQYVKPFSSNTGTLRRERQTDRIAISISRVSVLTRDKNAAENSRHFGYRENDGKRQLSLTEIFSDVLEDSCIVVVIVGVLGERYVTFALRHPKSVCRLSVCRLWRSCSLLWGLNGNQGLGQFALKLWTNIRRESRWSCKLNRKRCEKIVIFDQYLALFRKQHKIWP